MRSHTHKISQKDSVSADKREVFTLWTDSTAHGFLFFFCFLHFVPPPHGEASLDGVSVCLSQFSFKVYLLSLPKRLRSLTLFVEKSESRPFFHPEKRVCMHARGMSLSVALSPLKRSAIMTKEERRTSFRLRIAQCPWASWRLLSRSRQRSFLLFDVFSIEGNPILLSPLLHKRVVYYFCSRTSVLCLSGGRSSSSPEPSSSVCPHLAVYLLTQPVALHITIYIFLERTREREISYFKIYREILIRRVTIL